MISFGGGVSQNVLSSKDVVVTSYGVLVSEFKQVQRLISKKD